MNRPGRRGIILSIAGLAIAVFGILFIGRMVNASLSPLPQATPPPAVKQKVVVTTHTVAVGAVLKAEDLKAVEVPVELAPPNTLNDLSAVIGRMTKVQLAPGEIVMPHHLADPTNVNHDLAFVINENQVIMAFPIEDLMSQLNILQRGDQVDILVSVEEPVQNNTTIGVAPADQKADKELFTFNSLQRVQISAVVVEIVQNTRTTGGNAITSAGNAVATAQPTPEPNPADVKPKALLLALAPQDALVLKHLRDAGGKFDLVLRAPNSTQLFDSFPVSPQFLIDRYKLEVSR
ncbi:MAG TPA: Flp pilus assembly protein CpaB [Anaerolineales bacterium]